MFWFTLFLWAATFVLSEVLRPKPKTENAKASGLGDFQLPTATEGRVVPLIWGTVKVSGPNVVWYGDLKQKPITKKQKTGIFSSTKTTTGYQYFLGIQFALCRGVVDRCKRIWIGDKIIYDQAGLLDEAHQLQDNNFFGGSTLGYGGINGLFRFHRGEHDQAPNAYLQSLAENKRYIVNTATVAAGTGYVVGDLLTAAAGTWDILAQIKVLTVDGGGGILTFEVLQPNLARVTPANPAPFGGGSGIGATFTVTYTEKSMVPTYRGTCFGMWEGGYIGNANRIDPWAFELQRNPNGLALTGGKDRVNVTPGGRCDSNPMNVIYEILTDTEWGLAANPGDIDLTNFRDAAATLFDEGNGWSFILDSAIEAAELLSEVERQIDGVVFLDRETGKYKINLARADYVLADIPELNETNIISVESYTRGAWEDTSNIMRVNFVDREQDYKETYALAQDSANVRLQGNTLKPNTSKYPGCQNAALGRQLAMRDLRTLAYPLAKARLITNRTMSRLNPGDVIKWSDSTLNVVDLPMRITRVDLGSLDKNQVVLDLVQDVFAHDVVAGMGVPPNTTWIPILPDMTDINALSRIFFEAPKAFCDRAEETPGTIDRIWVGSRDPQDQSTNVQIWSDENGAGYIEAGDVAGYLLAGKLSAQLLRGTVQGSTDITVVPDPDTQAALVAALTDTATPEQMGRELRNLVLINNEFFTYQSATVDGANVVLNDCYRSLLDTVQGVHAMGDRVWFIGLAGNLTDQSYGSTATVNLKLLTDSTFGTLALADATASTVVMTKRAHRPYPPVSVRINAGEWATATSIDTNSGATQDTKGIAVDFVRRDFRTEDEVASVLSEDGAEPGFPTANDTEYKLSLFDTSNITPLLVKESDWQSDNTYQFSRTKILRETMADTGGDSVFVDGFTGYPDGPVGTATSGAWQEFSTTSSSTPGTDTHCTIVSEKLFFDDPSGFARWARHTFATPHVFDKSYTWTANVTYTGGNVENTDIRFRFNLVPNTLVDNIQVVFYIIYADNSIDPDAPDVDSFMGVVISSPTGSSTTIVGRFPVGTYDVGVVLNPDLSITALVGGAPVATRAGALDAGIASWIKVGVGATGNRTGSTVTVNSVSVIDAAATPASSSLPDEMEVQIETRHTYNGVELITAANQLRADFATSSTELASLGTLGVREVNRATAGVTAAATGNYTVDIGTAAVVTVEYRLNGSTWTSASAPFAVTTGDVIELRHTTSGSNANETFVELKNPSGTAVAFGVFTY